MVAAAAGTPAPPKSGGGGCLKAFLIVLAICFVVGIGLVTVLVFVVGRTVDKVGTAAQNLNTQLEAQSKIQDRTGIATNPIGFDKKHPPQMDVYKRPLSCSSDSSTSEAAAAGSVKNNSRHASSYLITVEFRRDDVAVSGAVADVYRVDPGQVMNWKATGAIDDSTTGKLTCAVTGILRSDNPDILPSTTTTEH